MRIFPQPRASLLLFASFFLPFISLFAQSPDCSIHWDTPTQISYDSTFYSSPLLAVTGDTVHVTWLGSDLFGTVEHDGVQYCRSTDRGRSFTPETTIASFDSAQSPAIIAAFGSSVFLAFEAFADTFSGTMLARSTDAGASWLPALRFLPQCKPLVIDAAEGNVFLHYINTLTRKYGFLRSTDEGVTWRIQNPDMIYELTSMFLRDGEIHAVASFNSNVKEVLYVTSADFGANWRFMEYLSNEFDFTASLYPKIAGNAKRDLYVVWNDTGLVYVRHSANNGLSWIPPARVSAADGAVFPDVGADREFVTAVWDNNFAGTSTIRSRSSNDFGFTYCPIEHPTADSGTGGPAIRLTGNDVHLVWSTIDSLTGTIVYRHGTVINNPEVVDHPPSQYLLAQNFPNPFNDVTRIRFELPGRSHVTLVVYDILGRVIARLVDDDRDAGRYEVMYKVTELASGMYIYEITAGEYAERKKLLIIK